MIETFPAKMPVSHAPRKEELIADNSKTGSAVGIGIMPEFVPADPSAVQDENGGKSFIIIRSIAWQNGWRFEVMLNSALAKGDIFDIYIPLSLVPLPAAPAVRELPSQKKRGRPAWKNLEALILETAPLIRNRIDSQRKSGCIPGQISYRMIAEWIGEDRISWHSVRKLHLKGSGEARKAIDGIYRDAPILIREAVRMIAKEIRKAQKGNRGKVYQAVDIPEIARRIGKDNISVNAIYWAYNHGPTDLRSKIDSILRDNRTRILEAIELLSEERVRITETSIARKTGLCLSCINREKKLHPELENAIGAAKAASRTWPKCAKPGGQIEPDRPTHTILHMLKPRSKSLLNDEEMPVIDSGPVEALIIDKATESGTRWPC